MKKYVFSFSQLKAAECSNLYHIRYNLKLTSKRYSRIKALRIGKLFHAGLEILYRTAQAGGHQIDDLLSGKMIDNAVDHIRALAKQMRKELVSDENESRAQFKRKLDIDMEIPAIMIRAYYNYIFLRERYEIVEPEKEIVVSIRTPSGRRSPNMFYRAFIDAIIRNISGDNRLYMHEVKTAAAWSSKNDYFLAIDDQTTGYHWVAREIGLKLEGTIYTICLKPASKPNLLDEAKKRKSAAKKEGKEYTYKPVEDYESAEQYLERIEKDYNKNPGKYFVRKIFSRTDEQMNAFQVQLYYKCQDAKRLKSMPHFMQPNIMKCPGCDGYDLCQSWNEETVKLWYTRKGEFKEGIEEIILD